MTDEHLVQCCYAVARVQVNWTHDLRVTRQNSFHWATVPWYEQGHHHNGDQVARRSTTPHDVLNMWPPICDPSVWGTWESVIGLFSRRPAQWFLLATHWHIRPTCSDFQLFIWLQKRLSARPSAPDTMTNTVLEAIASSIGKTWDARCEIFAKQKNQHKTNSWVQ